MNSAVRDVPGEVTVFYDGSCPLCASEIAYYKARDVSQSLELVDVSSNAFVEDNRLSRSQAMARFHVRLASGEQLSGAGAFVEMWRHMPKWRWVATLARFPGAMALLELTYRGFLKVRPGIVRVFIQRRQLGRGI